MYIAFKFLSNEAAIPQGSPYRARIEDMLMKMAKRSLNETHLLISWHLLFEGDPFAVLRFIYYFGDYIRPTINEGQAVACARKMRPDWLRMVGPTHCAFCEKQGVLYVNHPQFDQAAKAILINCLPLTRDVLALIVVMMI